MAKRTKGVTEDLLAAAEKEFLEKGYKNASLRHIAERAGSSKGAIYIRYPDKSALYRAVVEPPLDVFCTRLNNALNGFMELDPDQQEEHMHDYSNAGSTLLIDCIFENYDAFKILVTSGELNLYNEFIHRLVEIDNRCTKNFIEVTKNDAFTSGRLTEDLMHMITNSFYSGVFEIVVHDMPKERALEHFDRLRNFYNAGWDTLLGATNRSDSLGSVHELSR